MSNYRLVRDVESSSNLTCSHSLHQARKDFSLRQLQAIPQQVNDLVRVDLGHNAFVEIQRVQPIVPSIAVVRKRRLCPAALG